MNTPIISLVRRSRSLGFALLFASGAITRAGTPVVESKETKEAVPAETEPWEFTLAVPGWLAATSGTIGLNGINSHVYMGFDTLLKHLDMTASLSAEARKGRWGIYGDMLYVKASDAVYPDGLIGKADIRLDQWIADLEVKYRVLEGPRGYLDLRAGVRYTDLYNKLALTANNSAINQASADLVDDVAGKVKDRLGDLDLKSHLRTVLANVLRSRILNRLAGAEANEPALAIAPIGGGPLSHDAAARAARDGVRTRDGGALAAEVDAAVQTAVDAKLNALAAALRAKAAAVTPVLQAAAQNKIDSIKQQIADRIASVLKDKLNTSASLNERWVDPYVGFDFRYNLSKAWYLTGKADIGGFGIGSEITWQAYGALGCQVTRYIFIEAGYRYLYTDYNQGGFLYDVSQSGAQVTAGIIF